MLLVVGATAGGARAQPAPGASPVPTIAARFSGEQLRYDVSVLFFRRAAISRLTLEREPADDSGRSLSGSAAPTGAGRYLARASVETKGFVGWLAKRRHVYTSSLVACEDGRRWCSRRFVMDLTERDHREVRTTVVDPASGVVAWTIERDGVVVETGSDPMQPGRHYDDMLAALYNFRAGVYGPLQKGTRYEIQTLPLKGVQSFTIRALAGDEEAEARRKLELGTGGMVIAAEIPEAVFGRKAEVFAWLSVDLVPLGGTVEDYIGFGDLRGRLVGSVRPVDALREERR